MLNACPTEIDFDVYQPRNPKAGAYYRCVEDYYEHLEAVWDKCYQRRFGFWRPYVMNVIHRYLDCGDLLFGFARVKCEDYGHEYLLAFSRKRRHFCPSCHQKRVLEFGEWLCTEVLKHVPHRQWVFSIPKRLRITAKMAGPVVCYQNKYIIISSNWKDSIQARHVNFRQYVDWSGEIYNCWQF
jgi:hypothetical protein